MGDPLVGHVLLALGNFHRVNAAAQTVHCENRAFGVAKRSPRTLQFEKEFRALVVAGEVAYFFGIDSVEFRFGLLECLIGAGGHVALAHRVLAIRAER
jgi:hypothetical protein